MDICYVSRCGPRTYFLATQLVKVDSVMNWRVTHERERTYFLVKDASKGTVDLLYTA